jgi:hypothetical protein
MQIYISMVVALVLSLLSGRYPQHVAAWKQYLVPLRDALNQLYPAEQHPAGDVAPPLPHADTTSQG